MTTAAFVLILIIAWGSYWLAIFFQELFFGADAESVLSSSLSFQGHVLVVIAAIGLPLAMWRVHALQTQSTAALEQSNTAQSNLLNERYQKGVEMLGNQKLSVRLGGIHALGRLAKNEPPTYHIEIMSVLCAYVRNWHIADRPAGMQSKGIPDAEESDLPEDVGTALEVIGSRSNKQREIEAERKYTVALMDANLCRWMCNRPGRVAFQNFSHVNFAGADLSETFMPLTTLTHSIFMHSNLSNTILMRADISDANFFGADLSEASPVKANLTNALFEGAKLIRADISDANFSGADLSRVSLVGADLTNALFEGAKLSGTDLSEAKGLTQEQLNSAHIDPQRPPILPDAMDPHTGKPLVVPDQKPTS